MKFIYLTFSVLLFSQIIISQNSFTAKLEVPNEIVQGEYSEIILNIYKPKGARNYLVFSQKLPKGFFLKMVDAQSASYTYENSTLTLTWLRCPVESKFTVKYKIASMHGIAGHFKLVGDLKYMAGVNNANFKLKKQEFNLVKQKSDNIVKTEEDLIIKKQDIRLINNKIEGVTCERGIKYNKKDNFYEVEISLKSNKKGEYNIVEEIPKGFNFIEDEISNVKLKKQLNTVQFMWKSSLQKNNLKIKYKLIQKSKNVAKPFIHGKLSLLNNKQIYNMAIITTD